MQHGSASSALRQVGIRPVTRVSGFERIEAVVLEVFTEVSGALARNSCGSQA